MKFNVFGKHMSVSKQDGEWQLFRESTTGIKTRIYDVVFPVDIKEAEIRAYLDDIYHEQATDKHPSVFKIG